MILGLDIGGTNTDAVLMKDADKDFDSYVDPFIKIETFKTSEILPEISRFIDSWPDVEAVGVGIAAWIRTTPDGFEFINAPNLSTIPELKLSKPHIIDNDANCFAYFSSKMLGYRNLFAVTVGTGIGGGLVVDGRVYRGCGAAGEIGHTYIGGDKICKCGGKGHLETYFGGWAIKNVEEKVESGEIYENKGFKLFCMALANTVMLLNPEAVVIGGRIGGRLDALKIHEEMEKFVHSSIDFEVHTVKDDHAVAKGAALLARDTIL